jgi:hypothetical protein
MWEYERRSPTLSQRELTLGAQVSSGPMAGRFAACREILRYDPNNSYLLNRCLNCGHPHHCQIKYCDKCFNSPLDPRKWHVDPTRFISLEVVNPIVYTQRVGYGGYRHIEKVKKMMEPFYGLPVKEIAPFTVKFCCLQGGEDYVKVKDYYHSWMREIATGFRDLIHPDVKLVYRFEWSWTTAGNAAWKLPLRAPGVVDATKMDPDQVVAFFHCHGLARFPGFEFSKAGEFFRMVFDAPWQVQVEEPVPDRVVRIRVHDPELMSYSEPSFPDSKQNNLIDHPDDVYDIFDLVSDDPTLSCSVDQLLDAMAAERHLEDEDADSVCATYQHYAAGLAGWANYACKEHLPKAESSFQKKATIKAASVGADGSPNQHSGQEHNSEKKLTPEQMVVACHGDAELKRAFHGRRLTHTLGTVKKSKTKRSKASSLKQPNVLMPKSVTK